MWSTTNISALVNTFPYANYFYTLKGIYFSRKCNEINRKSMVKEKILIEFECQFFDIFTQFCGFL